MNPEAIQRLWFGTDPAARAARAVLLPFAGLFRAVVAGRNGLYEAGAFTVHETPIPAIAVGNVTVGGTGKTPVSAWIAGRLQAQGSRPALVLRGYGDDEPLVHRLLNPGIPVIVAPDRVRGVAEAAAMGATVAVLDDAFQHRRVRRVADVVLVSADQGLARSAMLPMGPFREPLVALRRASIVLVTRKAVAIRTADEVAAQISAVAPDVPVGIVHLGLGELRRVRHAPTGELPDGAGSAGAAGERGGLMDETRQLAELRGEAVLAVAALGEPEPFLAQLRGAGALVESAIFPDHHQFSHDDIRRILATYPGTGSIVCTLKDAVKLGPRWPREAPALWYVTQVAALERGASDLDAVLRRAASADSNSQS